MIPRALRPWKAHAAFRWPERIHRMTHLLQWNDRFVIVDALAVSMSCWRRSEIRRQVRAVLERDSRRGLGVHSRAARQGSRRDRTFCAPLGADAKHPRTRLGDEWRSAVVRRRG